MTHMCTAGKWSRHDSIGAALIRGISGSLGRLPVSEQMHQWGQAIQNQRKVTGAVAVQLPS